MTERTWSRMAAAGWMVLALSACATASSPWVTHDQTADLKARADEPDRVCPVVVQNGTDRVLEAMVERGFGSSTSLGLLGAGQSVSLGVACADRRVAATAVVVDAGALEGSRVLHASALLDEARETHLRFTVASGLLR